MYQRFEINYKNILEISLVPEDYSGPEAIGVYFDSGEMIIFN